MAAEDLDKEIFSGKTLSNLFEDIYKNSVKKEKQIKSLITQLSSTIGDDLSQAMLIVPLIKEYLDISIKNDDHLIKLAGIVQKALARNEKGSDDFSGLFSAEEQAEMSKLIEEVAKQHT